MSRITLGVALAGVALVLGACSSGATQSPPGATPSVSPSATGNMASASPSAEATMPAAYASNAPYAPDISAADFVDGVDNPFFPLVPGTVWRYEGSGDTKGETTITTVTDKTRTVMGVVCVVVHDEVRRGGEAVEITDDWYAQDRDGNVWYMGEDTAEYRNGQVSSREGSWEAGVDGALPGIIMPADPQIDLVYRQEFKAGEAEDLAKVVELGASADVPAGSYDDVLVTEDWSPLEPAIHEHKFYARGIGIVMERDVSGGNEINKLVELTQP